jgi:hypothetical protein
MKPLAYYMDNIIKPTVMQNGVVQNVPFIYGSPERWKQVQKMDIIEIKR